MKKSILATTIAISILGLSVTGCSQTESVEAPSNKTLFAKEVQLDASLPSKGKITELQKKNNGDITVTRDNFIKAETDKYLFEQATRAPMNEWKHDRELVTPQNQTVVRQNRDTLYSKAVVDISEGATFTLPKTELYQSIYVIDENHFDVAVIYPGESVTVTKDMLTEGTHAWVILRTAIKSTSAEDLKKGNEVQDQAIIKAKSAKPYISKGFNQQQREDTRIDLEKDIMKMDMSKAFGKANDKSLETFHRTVGASMGWGGFKTEDAHYKLLVAEDRSGVCSSMTFEEPKLKKNGFFSVTAYGGDGYIHVDNYAISSRDMKANEDGSYTVTFNCKDTLNNINVVEGWTGILRMYLPEDTKEILAFDKTVMMPKTVK